MLQNEMNGTYQGDYFDQNCPGELQDYCLLGVSSYICRKIFGQCLLIGNLNYVLVNARVEIANYWH
jgi:hypothetical protein